MTSPYKYYASPDDSAPTIYRLTACDYPVRVANIRTGNSQYCKVFTAVSANDGAFSSTGSLKNGTALNPSSALALQKVSVSSAPGSSTPDVDTVLLEINNATDWIPTTNDQLYLPVGERVYIIASSAQTEPVENLRFVVETHL